MAVEAVVSFPARFEATGGRKKCFGVGVPAVDQPAGERVCAFCPDVLFVQGAEPGDGFWVVPPLRAPAPGVFVVSDGCHVVDESLHPSPKSYLSAPAHSAPGFHRLFRSCCDLLFKSGILCRLWSAFGHGGSALHAGFNGFAQFLILAREQGATGLPAPG